MVQLACGHIGIRVERLVCQGIVHVQVTELSGEPPVVVHGALRMAAAKTSAIIFSSSIEIGHQEASISPTRLAASPSAWEKCSCTGVGCSCSCVCVGCSCVCVCRCGQSCCGCAVSSPTEVVVEGIWILNTMISAEVGGLVRNVIGLTICTNGVVLIMHPHSIQFATIA